MERSCSMSSNVYKIHLYEYGGLENKRYLGALCCRSEDVEAGVVLPLEPVIKGLELFDVHTVKERHKGLPTFLYRKENFASPDAENQHRSMLKGLRRFLEDLRKSGKCAVLDNDTVLALGEEMYRASALPQDPAIFLHVPTHLSTSPTYSSPAPRDGGDHRTTPTTSTTPPQQQIVPPDPASSAGLTSSYKIPSGNAGDGVGRGSGEQSKPCTPLPLPPPPPPPRRNRELRSEEAQLAGQMIGQGVGAESYVVQSPISLQPPPPRKRELRPEEGRPEGARIDQGGGAESCVIQSPISPPPPPPPRNRELRPEEGQPEGARIGQGGGAESYVMQSPLPTPPQPQPQSRPPSQPSKRELRPDERTAYGQLAITTPESTAPQHNMVMARHPVGPVDPFTHGQLEGSSPGGTGTGHGFGGLGAWGAPPPSPPVPLNTPQANGQVMGGAMAGVGGTRTVAITPQGRRLSSSSVGGIGEGSATPPAPTGLPTFPTGVGSESSSREVAPGSTVGIGGCNGSWRTGGGIGCAHVTPEHSVTSMVREASAAPHYDHTGVQQLRLGRTPSVNAWTFKNLAEYHKWAFGAAAELLHNSSDAEATEVRVSLEDLGPERETNFVVIDNGRGMTHSEMEQMFTLGKDYGYGSTAPTDERIGCNGFGFKQGALRLGDTAVVVSVRGKVPAPGSLPDDTPTASFGILSIEAYRRSLETEGERQPVVVEYATLNLLTMQADERFNTQEEYDAAVDVIRRLVPYFTREYLGAYVKRFVRHPEGSAWEVSDIKSSTSIFVSRLKRVRNKLELIKDIGGTDIRLEDRKGNHARLPGRPKSCSSRDGLCPPMDHSLRSFCEQVFLEPKMKIFVQGSEVKTVGLLSSLREKEAFAIDISSFLDEAENGDPPPPYNITVQVGQDTWHHQKGLSGIMVYFENCLVDSYARGTGLPSVVQKNERGYLAIVAFSGDSNKELFRPNPTKVGFPADNERYLYVLKTAGEALTQVVENVHAPNEKPLGDDEELEYWIECSECGKYRKVSKEYHDLQQASDGWHCGIEGSHVPLPKSGSNKCHVPQDEGYGRTVAYEASAPVVRIPVEHPRKVFKDDFSLGIILGKGSSATVYAVVNEDSYEGKAHALKVFKDQVTWRREKDILWELEKERKPHPNICSLSWICEEPLTLALKPLLPGSCPLSKYMEDSMHGDGTRPELKNHERLGIAEKVADALRHLHNRKICHNDVQPSNIVLGLNPKENVLLVDFSEARKFSPKIYSSNTPLRYAPPEVLMGQIVSNRGECDMFGFGVTMVELFAGQTLFGPEAVRDGVKLRKSLRTLAKLKNLINVPFEDMKETLPGLAALHEKDGMKRLAKICRACVNADTGRRCTSGKLVDALAKFRRKANFYWRHGTSTIYHTLEPGDGLHFSRDGAFVKLTRLRGTSGNNSVNHHIKKGSEFGYRSRYISCSLTLSFCIFYAQKQWQMFSKEGFGLPPILEIDLSKLDCGDLGNRVIDLTRLGRQDDDETALGPLEENFTGDAEEVILNGIDVPRAAITAVYSLDFSERPGESSSKYKDRVGQLQKLDDTLKRYARKRCSKFAEWEKNYNKFTRQKGNAKRSPQEQLKIQALVPKERVEAVLRASYCGRRRRGGIGSPSGGVASGGVVGGGGASCAQDAGSRGGTHNGGAAAGGARGIKRGQQEGGQPRSKARKFQRANT